MAFSTFSVVQPQTLSTSKTFSTHQEETWYGWDTFKSYCHKAVKVSKMGQEPKPASPSEHLQMGYIYSNISVVVVYSQDGLRLYLAGEL